MSTTRKRLFLKLVETGLYPDPNLTGFISVSNSEFSEELGRASLFVNSVEYSLIVKNRDGFPSFSNIQENPQDKIVQVVSIFTSIVSTSTGDLKNQAKNLACPTQMTNQPCKGQSKC